MTIAYIPSLPIETIEHVIDQLDPFADKKTLKTLGLVSRSVYPRSRFRLFHSIDFDTSRDFTEFIALSSSKTHISQYVRKVGFPFDIVWSNKKLNSMKRLYRARFKDGQKPSADAPLLWLVFPNVTHLKFFGDREIGAGVSAHIIHSFPHLQELLIVDNAPGPLVYPPPPTLRRLELTKCMDFDLGWLLASPQPPRLERLAFLHNGKRNIETLGQYLAVDGPTLQHLTLNFRVSDCQSYLNHVNLAANTSLRSLTLGTAITNWHNPHRFYRFLDCAVALLATATAPGLTKLTIEVNRFSRAVLWEEHDAWERLDTLLAEPRFAAVREVRFQAEADPREGTQAALLWQLPWAYERGVQIEVGLTPDWMPDW